MMLGLKNGELFVVRFCTILQLDSDFLQHHLVYYKKCKLSYEINILLGL